MAAIDTARAAWLAAWTSGPPADAMGPMSGMGGGGMGGDGMGSDQDTASGGWADQEIRVLAAWCSAADDLAVTSEPLAWPGLWVSDGIWNRLHAAAASAVRGAAGRIAEGDLQGAARQLDRGRDALDVVKLFATAGRAQRRIASTGDGAQDGQPTALGRDLDLNLGLGLGPPQPDASWGAAARPAMAEICRLLEEGDLEIAASRARTVLAELAAQQQSDPR